MHPRLVGVAVGLAMLIGGRPGPVAHVHAQTGPRMKRISSAVIALVAVLAMTSGATGQGLSLGVASNRDVFYPGDRLELTVSVRNTGGAGAADFYVGIILPDGITVATIDAGGGARLGTLAQPAAFAAVARGVGLGGPFSASVDPLFNYAWTGTEPLGSYTVFLAAVQAGGFADNRIDGGDVLAVRFGTLVMRTPVSITPEGPSVRTPVTVDAGGTVSVASIQGTQYQLAIPPDALVTDTTVVAAPIAAATGLPVQTLLGAVRFGPDGLQLRAPATLTITLPAVIKPLGLIGFTVKDDGTGFQPVPVTISGRTATMTVTHFSAAGFGISRCGPEVTTTVGRDACARMADALTRAAAAVSDDPTRIPLPVRLLLAAEVATELRTWLASITRSLSDASDASRLDSAEHYFLMNALRELSAVEAIVELMEGLDTGEIVGPELAAARALIAPAIEARRTVANQRCLAPTLAERQTTSVYIGRILELAGEAEARGLPVDGRTRGITCLRLNVTVSFPASLPPGGARVLVAASLEFADGSPLWEPRMQVLGHTLELVDRGLAIISEPAAANGIGSVGLSTFIQRRSPTGTLAFDVRADVPGIGFSLVRRVTRDTSQWTISSRQVTARGEFLPPGTTILRQATDTTSASIPNETLGSMSLSNLRTSMTTSPTTSTELVVELAGGGRLASTDPDEMAMRNLSSLTFSTTAAFQCSVQVSVTRSPPAASRGPRFQLSLTGPSVGISMSDSGSSAPRSCAPGNYNLQVTADASTGSNPQVAAVEYTARVVFAPVP